MNPETGGPVDLSALAVGNGVRVVTAPEAAAPAVITPSEEGIAAPEAIVPDGSAAAGPIQAAPAPAAEAEAGSGALPFAFAALALAAAAILALLLRRGRKGE